MSATTRNARKALGSNKRAQRKTNALGKPPLCIDTNKKYSVYPDASSYKLGTANSKILQLREHLTRSNTVSNPDLLKEEQAIIDSMFSEKGRQASRGREPFSSAVYSGITKYKKRKRGNVLKCTNINIRQNYWYLGIGLSLLVKILMKFTILLR